MDAGARSRMPLIWLAIWRACEYKGGSIEQKNLVFGVLLNTHTKDQERMPCKSCASQNQSKFSAEMNIHLPGFNMDISGDCSLPGLWLRRVCDSRKRVAQADTGRRGLASEAAFAKGCRAFSIARFA